jgi:hypothetical protein
MEKYCYANIIEKEANVKIVEEVVYANIIDEEADVKIVTQMVILPL